MANSRKVTSKKDSKTAVLETAVAVNNEVQYDTSRKLFRVDVAVTVVRTQSDEHREETQTVQDHHTVFAVAHDFKAINQNTDAVLEQVYAKYPNRKAVSANITGIYADSSQLIVL